MSAAPDTDGARRTRLLATALLVALTAVWGSTFFLIRDLVRTVPPLDFLALRFSIAAVLMVLVFWRPLRALGRREWAAGAVLGLLYGVAQVLQTIGLSQTDASVSGFITGLYVVLTPVLSALLLQERVGTPTWVAVALSTAGLAVLSLRGVAVGTGEALTLACAAVYALHIIGLGRWSTPRHATGMSAVQMLVIAAVSVVGAVPGGMTWPQGAGQWASVLYMATAAASSRCGRRPGRRPAHRDPRRHRHDPRTRLRRALRGALRRRDPHPALLLGGVLVVAAMYVVELAGRWRPRRGREPVAAEALHHEAG